MEPLRRIEEATPPGRDHYLDFLRVLALLLVVSGHWIARVVLDEGGAPSGHYLLNLVPELQWASLIWQVMPVFFLVGGVVNARSWRRARQRHEAPAAWAARRARSLLMPLLVLVAALVPAAALTEALAHSDRMIFGFTVAVFPLWFLATYMAVTALTPLTLALHERGATPAFLAALMVVVVVLDLLRLLVGGPVLGTQPVISGPNFLLLWLAVHQLGYLWADGRLEGRGLALLAAGAAGLVAMIGLGPWPLSMVPFEGTTRPNNGSPPTAALMALALVQLGLSEMARPRVARWLARPVLWAPVAVIGSQMITLYLWHQPAMVAMAELTYRTGWLPMAQALDAQWWAGRPLWLLACLAGLIPMAVLASLLSPRPREAVPPGPGAARVAAGIVLVGAGTFGLIQTGLVQPAMPANLPLISLLALFAGMALLGLFTRAAPARR